VVAVLAILWATGVFSQSVTVPDVTGMTVSKASTALTDAGLSLGTVTYKAAAGETQGTILSQDPAAGASAEKGSAVSVVAAGVATKGVPNILGLTQEQATAAITDAGFALGSISQVYDASAPVGQVVDQAPAADTQLLPGSQVAIAVSQGPAPAASPQAVSVPNVVGQTQTQAQITLQGVGLTTVIEKVPDSSVEAGTVTDQTPAAGVFVQPGSSVTIIVAQAVPTSPSP
jgi:serine/threonine-protein kinase